MVSWGGLPSQVLLYIHSIHWQQLKCNNLKKNKKKFIASIVEMQYNLKISKDTCSQSEDLQWMQDEIVKSYNSGPQLVNISLSACSVQWYYLHNGPLGV